MGFLGGTVFKNPPANKGDAGDMVLIPRSGRFPGVGNGNPLGYCCLRNPMEKGAWRYSPWGGKESDATEHTRVLPLLACVTRFGEGHTGRPIMGLSSWKDTKKNLRSYSWQKQIY